MQTNYKPTGNFIIVALELEPEKESEDSVIVKAESFREYIQEAEVIKCGPEVSSNIKPGCFVCFSKNSEYKFNIDGILVAVVSENNVVIYREAKPKFFKEGASDTEMRKEYKERSVMPTCTCATDPTNCKLPNH